jgi:hypothetical protein
MRRTPLTHCDHIIRSVIVGFSQPQAHSCVEICFNVPMESEVAGSVSYAHDHCTETHDIIWAIRGDE